MKRILILLAGLLCLSTLSFAQAPVPSDTALTAAINDVNAKVGASYTYDGGQLNFQFSEERVNGDNLGCAAVAATNQNAYVVMVTSFDFNFDSVFEWEHRFAYEADGSLKMVVCRQPDLSTQPTQAPTATATATIAPEDPQVTPEGTPVNPAPIFGRDGPRIFPAMICGGLPTRLVNGSLGRVIPGGAQNNLRQSPDLTSLKIGELSAGTSFTVMDGPFCNGDIAWYLVGDGATPTGWTAEGVDGDYFLEPQLTDAQLIRPENVAQLAPVGGVFGPAVSLSANHPRSLVISIGESVQLWGIMGGFSPLATLQGDVIRELMTAHDWVFADNTGRIWTVTESGGSAQLSVLEDTAFTPLDLPQAEDALILAVDNESNFAATVVMTDDPASVMLYQIGRNGALNEQILTLTPAGDVLDVAFSADSMRLYVLTANALTMYPYVRGEGWSGQASETIAHDLMLGSLAVDQSNDQVAIAGTTEAGTAALRVFSNLSNETAGDETVVNFDADGDVRLLSPAFNADGSLVAAFSTDDSVLLLDTATGATFSLDTGDEDGAIGSVEFSRDGLLLWVSRSLAGVQAYAVAQPAQ